MNGIADPVILVFRVQAPGQGLLLPVSPPRLKGDLGLRPLALAEMTKEADRPSLVILSDSEDLLARTGQLAPRCGLVHASGATVPTQPVVPRAGDPGGESMEHPLVNGTALSGSRQAFDKLFEVLAASGDSHEAILARAGDLALSGTASTKIRFGTHEMSPSSLDRDGIPLVMGILNVTPDSFSDGGRFLSPAAALDRGLELVDAGADILDIGGESSRPGSEPVSMEEECRRILPVVELLAARTQVPLSIDTTKAEVARRALEAGAHIINDISGLGYDQLMGPVAAAARAPLIINHMRGVPKTMQESANYAHPVLEVLLDLAFRIQLAKEAGVASSRIIVDPGIGFGKRIQDNLALIRNLAVLRALQCPILIGVSRKSFLGTLTGREAGDRLAPTLAAETLAALAGAEILRTHDPEATRDAMLVARALY